MESGIREIRAYNKSVQNAQVCGYKIRKKYKFSYCFNHKLLSKFQRIVL
jgi:hypothetical protein